MSAYAADNVRLAYDWPSWARDNQIEPPGKWNTWLLLGGRGFGKTRTAAEWIRALAERGKDRRIALLGRTSSDVRDVMIEGESGILNICPPWFKPVYEPSKRRLTWPNGVIATTFSADEPDMLRGPQFHAAWCLVGETLVTMGDNTCKRLDAVRVGESVQTRAGPRRVLGSALTRKQVAVYRLRLVGGQTISGTYEHPVWIDGRGFVPLGEVRAGDSCVALASSGVGRRGTATQVAITSAPLAVAATTRDARSDFMSRSGALYTESCPTGCACTTLTKTSATTTWQTLSQLANESTGVCTQGICANIKPKRLKHLRKRLYLRASAMRQSVVFAQYAATHSQARRLDLVACAQAHALNVHEVACFNTSGAHACVVRKSTLQGRARSVFAASSATTKQTQMRSVSQESASAQTARVCSLVSEATRDFAGGFVRSPSTRLQVVVSVEKLALTRDVYDIAVEGEREFFANGILVHNCDELAAFKNVAAWDNLRFGLRLGRRPRVVVSTTPRPTDEIRALVKDPTTHVTTGSTYENKANLAPDFLKRILSKYEGTRLGDQEIHAKILEDTEGALWSQAIIDQHRVTKAPDELRRIVVAIDPAVSSKATSDETGIVTVGVDWEGHAFVLDDDSGMYKPDEWALKAVERYNARDADLIVAEVNNGGDLVEVNLRAVKGGRNVPYKAVHASRGKAVRAEPVSALYEQGKVHHVGRFAQLESQMTTYVPGVSSKSPDRHDSMIWAITELLLGSGMEFGAMDLGGGERSNPHNID